MTLLTDFTREFIECCHLSVFMLNTCKKRRFQRMQVCFSIFSSFSQLNILTARVLDFLVFPPLTSGCMSVCCVCMCAWCLCMCAPVAACQGRAGQGRASCCRDCCPGRAEQSRAGVLWSLFLSCSATWTFYHKPGIISSPLAFLLPVILTSCLLSLIPLFSLSL